MSDFTDNFINLYGFTAITTHLVIIVAIVFHCCNLLANFKWWITNEGPENNRDIE